MEASMGRGYSTPIQPPQPITAIESNAMELSNELDNQVSRLKRDLATSITTAQSVLDILRRER